MRDVTAVRFVGDCGRGVGVTFEWDTKVGTRFAPQVSAFLDLAEATGVRHVTFLSAYGMELAPVEVPRKRSLTAAARSI